MTTALFLVNPGPRPSFVALAYHLWGDTDFDSDGNCQNCRGDGDWTELTLIRRPRLDERIDVDPVCTAPLVLWVRATSPELANKAATYLAEKTNGILATDWRGFLPVGQSREDR